jgi:hypothetical protein
MDALQHITAVTPSLTEYMKENLVILEGDFPTWKFNKKIVADVSTLFNWYQLQGFVIFKIVLIY